MERPGEKTQTLPPPKPLRAGQYRTHIYEEIHLYESSLSGLVSPTESPEDGRPGAAEHQGADGPPPVHARPHPPLRTRLPSACLPPPLPPRSHPFSKKQLSCDLTHKLNRSRTVVDNVVSTFNIFSLRRDIKLL